MNATMEVNLNNVRLFGYHGLNDGEDITGGEFLVNLSAQYFPRKLPVSSIEDTIDYTALLSIVKSRMSVKSALLETIACDIASEIIAKFSEVNEVFISVSKLQPPIANFSGQVGVSFRIKRN